MKKVAISIVIIGIFTAIVAVVFLEFFPKNAQTSVNEETLSPSNPITEAISTMTLKEKVGQMFFVCVSNDGISTQDITKYDLGGYVLFADFFENRDKQSATETIKTFQRASKFPMLIGVDEEGGTVVRVSKYSAYAKTPSLSPQQLYEKGGFKAIQSDTTSKSQLLLDLGINVNLAPVCDISTNSGDFIYPRAFGKDPEYTSKYVTTVVNASQKAGIGSALKHFPGYGNNVDTHTGIAIDKRDYKSFSNESFLPFEAGIAAGAKCVLVNHNIINCMDDKNPASLSKNVHKELRKTLNFNGVIITDDLAMDAIADYTDDENTAVKAVKAGNDLLCIRDYKSGIPAVIDKVKSGEISKKQIDDSVRRIFKWKVSLGLSIKPVGDKK
ncbi:MAG: glycoside hydrolase family 3 N-terminal domain-containing protein [Anaerovoracaceae bacterium]